MMHQFTYSRAASRVILVELSARVIMARSGICAVHTVVPQKNADSVSVLHA